MLSTSADDCTGCEACVNACPVQAISLQVNPEGFAEPRVNSDICIKCNKCNKVCPLNHILSVHHQQKAYALWADNKQLLASSSSGGVFGVIATHVLQQGGVVCGAAFDRNNQVKHIVIDKLQDLPLLQGSKYVQSNLNQIYPTLKSKLQSGQLVLFCGTPCQVAGLKSYLGRDYAHLYTMDVACHGVPSPRIWQQYVKELGNDISQISFRDKVTGWQKCSFSYCHNGCKHSVEALKDIYFQGFVRNLFLRNSCYNCHYTNLNRPADFTLADFWGIKKYRRRLYNYQGTSLLLCNNEKADALLQHLRSRFATCQEVPLSVAVKRNKALSRSSTKHPLRHLFFEKCKKSTIGEAVTSILHQDETTLLNNNYVDAQKVGIMNFHYSNSNFGAVMVPFALSTVITRLGYKPEIINYIKDFKTDKNMVFEQFRENYLHRSFVCQTPRELELVSKNYQTFITGSDQVFRWHANGKYLFNFVSGMARLIAYAGSFGKDIYEYQDKPYLKMLFSRFDAVSVREQSGLDILQRDFACHGTWVLDPTLLLTADDYQKIIDNEKVITPNYDYVAYMFLNQNSKANALRKIINLHQQPCIDSLKTQGHFHSVGQWLNYIKNCRWFIADSFHGCVFAIIFHKQFICLTRDKGGNARIESLFKALGINPNRLISNLDADVISILQTPIDYEQVDKLLAQAQQQSMNYLQQALALPLTYKNKINIPHNHDVIYRFLGIPLWAVKVNNLTVDYKLFNCISIFRKVFAKKDIRIKLFTCLPFLSVHKHKGCKHYRLFNLLELYQINEHF